MLRPTTRVAAFQVAILIVVTAVAYVVRGEKTAMSAAYGAAVTLMASMLMLARERESESHSEWTARRQLGHFFRLAAERYLLVGGLLALGFFSGKVEPLALLIGFILAQAGWLAALKKEVSQVCSDCARIEELGAIKTYLNTYQKPWLAKRIPLANTLSTTCRT